MFLLPLYIKILIRDLLLSCRVIWICALLLNGCFSTPKGNGFYFNKALHVALALLNSSISLEYRYRSQSQNRNIGDDEHDERLISSGSEADDRDQKPAAGNTPTRVSSQQNAQPRPGSQAVGQLNRVAQGSAANLPLISPFSGPGNSPLGYANQQATATGPKNLLLSSSGVPASAPQSGGQSQLVSNSQTPEAQGLVFEEIFQYPNVGPAQPYGAGRGYDDGRHTHNFASQRSTVETGMPFYERYGAQPAGHAGVVYGNLVPTSYDEGLNSNPDENVPQGAGGLFMMPPPPPPYKPVFSTQSRHAYSRARYTHFQSRYSPDLGVPMPLSVDPQPLKDVPVIRKEPLRYCTQSKSSACFDMT